LDSDAILLKKQVFKAITGYYWYMRLRGHEIDNIDYGRKSFGQQYAIGKRTSDRGEISRLLMKLCEKTGRRLRKADYFAGGVHLWVNFDDRTFFSKGKKMRVPIYSTQDIYNHAQRLLNEIQIRAKATYIGVTVFDLKPASPTQLGLFDDTRLDTRALAYAADKVNDRYGEFTLVPATMAGMQDIILKRVAFGSVRDL
jgi:DNA polymerase-4